MALLFNLRENPGFDKSTPEINTKRLNIVLMLYMMMIILDYISIKNKKTKDMVTEQARHKPRCTEAG